MGFKTIKSPLVIIFHLTGDLYLLSPAPPYTHTQYSIHQSSEESDLGIFLVYIQEIETLILLSDF